MKIFAVANASAFAAMVVYQLDVVMLGQRL